MRVILVQSLMPRHDDRPVKWLVTAKSKAWALERMQEQGMNKSGLARAVGASRAYISMLFDEGRDLPVRNSTFWRAIVETLGGTPPEIPTPAADDPVPSDAAPVVQAG